MQTLKILGALAVLTTVGASFAIETYPLTAQAQTRGMEHRQDRRDTRQDSRAVKHECNASGGGSRSECRQEKRGTKQEGRHDRATGNTTNSYNRPY